MGHPRQRISELQAKYGDKIIVDSFYTTKGRSNVVAHVGRAEPARKAASRWNEQAALEAMHAKARERLDAGRISQEIYDETNRAHAGGAKEVEPRERHGNSGSTEQRSEVRQPVTGGKDATGAAKENKKKPAAQPSSHRRNSLSEQLQQTSSHAPTTTSETPYEILSPEEKKRMLGTVKALQDAGQLGMKGPSLHSGRPQASGELSPDLNELSKKILILPLRSGAVN